MADEMTKEEFSDYMTGFEQRIADRFGRTDRRLDGLDRRFDKVDGRLESMDGRLDSMDGRLDSMDGRLDEHDGRFDAVEKEMKRGFSELTGGLADMKGNVSELSDNLADLKQSMKVQFEESRREFKLSLEAAERVEQNTEAGFGEMRRDHAEHKAVLERSIHHARTRTDDIEKRARPTRRRR